MTDTPTIIVPDDDEGDETVMTIIPNLYKVARGEHDR